MQKPISTVQFTSQNPVPAARARQAPEAGGTQFNQALTREMAQRQQPAVKPANKPAAAEPAPKQAVKPASKQDQGAAKTAGPEQARKAERTEQARRTEGADKAKQARTAEDAADDDATVNPVADMLALVASFNQPQQAAAEVSSEPAIAAGGQNAGAQLAALQGAFGKLQAADGDKAALAGDGKSFNTRGRMDPSALGDVLDEQPALTGKAGIGAAAQPAAAADAKAVPGRTDFAQLLARDNGAEAAKGDAVVSAPLSAAVQQASLATAQVANAAASDVIPARVGTPGWDNQVAQKIIYMVGGEDMSASLTLNPPDLGPMQVVLNVNNDHADVTFTSAQPEVRQALEDAMPKLREMMSESGISLGNASVHDGSRQQHQQEPSRAGRGAGTGASTGGTVEADSGPAARPVRVTQGPGLVNTFA